MRQKFKSWIWMIGVTSTDPADGPRQNQFGRRNLPAYERSKLALMLKEIFAKQAKENQLRTAENRVCQISDKQEKPINTRQELAKIAGVSHDTIAKVEKIESQAVPELKPALTERRVSINTAAEINRASSIFSHSFLTYF